jgi:hypothetical protein
MKLKLGTIPHDKPVKITIEISSELHHNLLAYAELLRRETNQNIEPVRLIVPMLTRFIDTDRAFKKAKRTLDKTMQMQNFTQN